MEEINVSVYSDDAPTPTKIIAWNEIKKYQLMQLWIGGDVIWLIL